MSRTPVITIVGPTASGKTEVAVSLAKQVDGEILNADSIQIYKGMDIGSAKPGAEALFSVPFHLIDMINPDEPFTVSDWKSAALSAYDKILSRGKTVILSGGTGLYIRAFLEGWTLAETPADPAVREDLERQAQTEGLTSLYNILAKVDAASAQRIHSNDKVRIIRALEVYRVTNRSITEWQNENKETAIEMPSLKFGLSLPRDILNTLIDERVDRMMKEGLEQEVNSLLSKGYSHQLPSMRSLGYKEMTSYCMGEMNREEAAAAIKQNTRRYAKRQLTWFRADREIHWLDREDSSSEQIARNIAEQFHRQAH